MKKNLLIIIAWLTALITVFALRSQAQDTTGYTCNSGHIVLKSSTKKTLIADETYFAYTKTGAKITTTLESVFHLIWLKCGNEFQKIMIVNKKANGQRYKEYTIYISEMTGNNIRQWAIKNL